MLTILRVLDQHRSANTTTSIAASIERDKFKVIYVCVQRRITRCSNLQRHQCTNESAGR